jgi:hypothetical protein
VISSWSCLMLTDWLQFLPRCMRAQTGEEKAGDGESGSQPEGPQADRPELEVEPRDWDAIVMSRTMTITKVSVRRMREVAGSKRCLVSYY